MRGSVAAAFLCAMLLAMVSYDIYGIDWESKTIDEKPKDVVDYFLRLPICRFDKARDTTSIFNTRKRYLVEGETREVIVDIPNGYLQILNDENYLRNQLTVTYFKKSDGNIVIGFSEYYEGGDCDDYMITFYSYAGGTWNNVTDEVLPTIAFKDFWSKDTTFAIESFMLLDKCLSWNYILPRYGTKISVLPVAMYMFLCFEWKTYDNDFVLEHNGDSLLMEYFKTVDSRDYHSIELWWNKEKGIFEVGKRIKGGS